MSAGAGNREVLLLRKSIANMTETQNDLVRRPVSALIWWGLPIAIGASVDLFGLSLRAHAAICAVLFVWMATGCLLNARRCHRVHCYISGPVFLLGAALAALLAVGLIDLSSREFSNAVGAVLILALLSFIPEIVWRRYA
ncbi:MAG: hypothetical protein GC166_15085 [Alphaproteobacteria bacterium]|nr:hypothetical protein [Alphaproteobacteria bacterium]